MGCNKLERRKSGTHIPKGWRVRGERPYVQMGHDGDRPPWPARNRLCAQGNWLDDKPSRIGRTFGNWVHKQDRRSTMAPPYPPDWWRSPASGEVSAAACKSCAQVSQERLGGTRRTELSRCVQCRTSPRDSNCGSRLGGTIHRRREWRHFASRRSEKSKSFGNGLLAQAASVQSCAYLRMLWGNGKSTSESALDWHQQRWPNKSELQE